jgi:hypothetical protein
VLPQRVQQAAETAIGCVIIYLALCLLARRQRGGLRLLLADKDQSARHVATIMKRAYDARSKLAHGATLKPLKLPDGTPATLAEYVEIVGGYMRTALRMLIEAAAEGEPSPLDDWDAFTFGRLSRET